MPFLPRSFHTGLTSIFIFLFLVPARGHSSTLIVPDDYDLQAALDEAAAGDSVLIRAGTYTGSFSFSGKDLVLVGEAGAETTILDGQGVSRVLTIGAGVTMATRLVGLTFTRGYGLGGGVHVSASSGATILSCSFIFNRSPGFEGGPGGGLLAESGSSMVIEQCLFSSNRGGWGIGALIRGSAVIRDCVFRENLGRVGTAIFAEGSPSLHIERCAIFDNYSWTDGGTVIIWDSIGYLRQTTIAYNRDSWYALEANNGTGLFRVERCIVSHNTGYGAAIWPVTNGACINSWGNDLSNFDPDISGTNGNFSADPLYCDGPLRNLTLKSTSPCLPALHPNGDACGVIGRYDEGCEAIPTVPSTWSRLKTMLR